MENKEILYIDEKYKTPSKGELDEFQKLLKEFETCYAENQDKPVADWLAPKMQEQLPEKSPAEIQEMTTEIISTLKIAEKIKILWKNQFPMVGVRKAGLHQRRRKLFLQCQRRNQRNIWKDWILL